MRRFADDTNLFYSSDNLKQLESVMNQELKQIYDYCALNTLSIYLISYESCVRREEKYFSWYVRNSEEALLRKVGDSTVVNISEAVDPN